MAAKSVAFVHSTLQHPFTHSTLYRKTGARPGSGRVESPAVASAPPPPPAAPAVAPLASSSIAHDRLVFLLLALVVRSVLLLTPPIYS